MIKIFDAGEEFMDRYTVIIDQSMYTMSIHATMPDGVNMYCCEVPNDYESTGMEINFKDTPPGVRWGILGRLKFHLGDE